MSTGPGRSSKTRAGNQPGMGGPSPATSPFAGKRKRSNPTPASTAAREAERRNADDRLDGKDEAR